MRNGSESSSDSLKSASGTLLHQMNEPVETPGDIPTAHLKPTISCAMLNALKPSTIPPPIIPKLRPAYCPSLGRSFSAMSCNNQMDMAKLKRVGLLIQRRAKNRNLHLIKIRRHSSEPNLSTQKISAEADISDQPNGCSLRKLRNKYVRKIVYILLGSGLIIQTFYLV